MSSTKEPAMHSSVVCDACMTHGIRGPRFKCAVCDEYDLCQVCYTAGHHETQHAFLRFDEARATPVFMQPRQKSSMDVAPPPAQKIVTVLAPATLTEGQTFQVTYNNQSFLANVPAGGVVQGHPVRISLPFLPPEQVPPHGNLAGGTKNNTQEVVAQEAAGGGAYYVLPSRKKTAASSFMKAAGKAASSARRSIAHAQADPETKKKLTKVAKNTAAVLVAAAVAGGSAGSSATAAQGNGDSFFANSNLGYAGNFDSGGNGYVAFDDGTSVSVGF